MPIDPRDFLTPDQYRYALKKAEMEAQLLQAQQNMALGRPLTSQQIDAQRNLAKQQAQAKYHLAAQQYMSMPEADPARYQPIRPRTANFFVPWHKRLLGPVLWRKEIAAACADKMPEPMKRATIGVGITTPDGEKYADVRPILNAVLAGLKHHVKTVERASISMSYDVVYSEGPGFYVHLVEVPRADPVTTKCQMREVNGVVYCDVHRQLGERCLQAQRKAGMLGMDVGKIMQNIEPAMSPLIQAAQSMGLGTPGSGGAGGGGGGFSRKKIWDF